MKPTDSRLNKVFNSKLAECYIARQTPIEGWCTRCNSNIKVQGISPNRNSFVDFLTMKPFYIYMKTIYTKYLYC